MATPKLYSRHTYNTMDTKQHHYYLKWQAKTLNWRSSKATVVHTQLEGLCIEAQL